jgi:hypothetical protein
MFFTASVRDLERASLPLSADCATPIPAYPLPLPSIDVTLNFRILPPGALRATVCLITVEAPYSMNAAGRGPLWPGFIGPFFIAFPLYSVKCLLRFMWPALYCGGAVDKFRCGTAPLRNLMRTCAHLVQTALVTVLVPPRAPRVIGGNIITVTLPYCQVLDDLPKSLFHCFRPCIEIIASVKFHNTRSWCYFS